MNFKVRMKNFEGSIDEILELLDKGELDISEIEVSQITGQYLKYIRNSSNFDLDAADEFLISASKIMAKKIDSVLPEETEKSEFEEEEDMEEDDEELARHLLEYKNFKEAASFLGERFSKGNRVYSSSFDCEEFVASLNKSSSLEGVELKDLVLAFESVLTRKEGENEGEAAVEIKKHDYKVADKVEEIKEKLSCSSGIKLEMLFNGDTPRREIIVIFLAVLELVRRQEIRLRRDNYDSAIVLYPNFG